MLTYQTIAFVDGVEVQAPSERRPKAPPPPKPRPIVVTTGEAVS